MVSMPRFRTTSATASTAVSRVSGLALERAVAKNATSSTTVPSTSPRSAPMITDVAICEAASRRATRAIMHASSGNLRESAVRALCADASAFPDLPATEAKTGAMSSGPPNWPRAKSAAAATSDAASAIARRSARRTASSLLFTQMDQAPDGRRSELSVSVF